MKSTLTMTLRAADPPKYPKLKKLRKQHDCGGNHIVLFSAPEVGTLVYASPTALKTVGYHSTNWDERIFEDFDSGVVNLSNH